MLIYPSPQASFPPRSVVGRSVGHLVSRLVGLLVGRSVGRTVDRSVGRSVGQSVVRWLSQLPVKVKHILILLFSCCNRLRLSNGE